MVTGLSAEIDASDPTSRIATALFLVAMLGIGALVARKWQAKDVSPKDRLAHLLIMLVTGLAVSLFAR